MPADFATNFIAANGTLLPTFNTRFYAATGSMVIDSNQACANTPGGATVDQVGVTGGYSPDHFAEGTVGTIAGNTYTGLSARCGAAGSGNGVWWIGTSLGEAYIGLNVAGAFTTLSLVTGFAPGDFIRLEADGGTFRMYVNAVLVGSYADATFAAGAPGLAGFRDTFDSGLADLRVGDLHPSSSGLWMPGFVGSI